MGDFAIRLTHDKPIRESPRRYSPVEQEVLRKSVDEWVREGFAEPCLVNSHYACNMVVAAKKNEAGEWTALRTCHDYRNLNRATPREEHELHHIYNFLQWLGGRNVLFQARPPQRLLPDSHLRG